MAQPAELYPVLARLVVGSQAHGLAGEDSDTDYREAFYIPTRELLQVPRSERPKEEWDAQGRHTDDEAGWEIAKVIEMVMLGHPNAVELMFAPQSDEDDAPPSSEWADLQRDLRPYLLNTGGFVRSTLGYGQNCLTKLTRRDQENRRAKWKSTYLRVMYASIEFLETGEYPMRVPEPGWGTAVRQARNDELGRGQVLDLGEHLEKALRAAEAASPLPREPNTEAVNDWLLTFRHEHWSE